jgi:nucleotide-binding universal stress UspA family protein
MRVQMKSIICTTDFSDFSGHAVSYGIALAKEFRAKLYLCHVIDLSSAAMYGDVITYSVGQQNRIINYAHESLSQLVGEQTLDWEPLITIGHVASEIARMAEEKGVDLVISATHGRSGLKRIVLGSVTERLMRTLPCPLLVVRSTQHDFSTTRDQGLRLKRILVGCDFSSDSNLAVQYALSMAQEFQSELFLAHVIEPPVYKELLKPASARGEASEVDLRERLNEELANMVPEEAYNWCSPKTVLLAGQAHEELNKHALVQNVDLIVLGLRGHGLVETLLIGSTTARVIRQAPCPVLSVRPTLQGTKHLSD